VLTLALPEDSSMVETTGEVLGGWFHTRNFRCLMSVVPIACSYFHLFFTCSIKLYLL